MSRAVWDSERNLLEVTELPPPLGGQGYATPWSRIRSRWEPFDNPEIDRSRILHGATLELPREAQLTRLRIKPALGFHKCGSGRIDDWIQDFRLLGYVDNAWHILLQAKDLVENPAAGHHEFVLDDVVVSAAQLEVRRSGLDGEWTPWNLVRDGVELWGRPRVGSVQRKEGRLENTTLDLDNLPAGVHAEKLPGEIRFVTKKFEVGFWLGRPGFSYLALNEAGKTETQNLLFQATGNQQQGPMLAPVGSAPLIAPALYCDISGTTEVRGSSVRYSIDIGGGKQVLELDWNVTADGIHVKASRSADSAMEAWESSIWRTTFDSRVAAVNTIGELDRVGRTGTVRLPLRLHAPRYGTVTIKAQDQEIASWRSDADRPASMLVGELKLGEHTTDRGTYLLPAGTYSTEFDWLVGSPAVPVREGTPPEISAVLDAVSLTALTTRPDTGTLSNNAVSIHCPMSMDVWSRVTQQLAQNIPEIPALQLMRYSLERWLDGGPGYASGRIRVGDDIVNAEDDYLITGASIALGLARYLETVEDSEWVQRFTPQIKRLLTDLKHRDLDGDGLIESPQRDGVSGDYKWSTNWYDVISFGWKDAWVNATLFEALDRLARVLPALGAPELADGLAQWRDLVRENYEPCFLNPESGLIAGWRCAEDKLHDYAFLAVNGAAVTSGVLEPATRKSVMKTLLAEYERLKTFDQRWGLPVNLWPIPDADLTEPMHGYAHGFYLNGALSLSQSHHFIEGLLATGFTAEADSIMKELARGIKEYELFSGSLSGVDWRFWDGAPCGYEGILTEQFGIIATLLERYGTG